jgi:2-polyprenyl-3-methyl-5-hydroxy-6-metoxy-1,4-benzoquinol methylase
VTRSYWRIGGAAPNHIKASPEVENRDHWNSLGANYRQNWSTVGQQALSDKELAFVVGHLPDLPALTVLDVGIGNGRILEALAAQRRVKVIYGVDIAATMVEVCRSKFMNETKVGDLRVCDISREPLPVPGGLHFISAIRMLKYNRNWWGAVEDTLAPHLSPGGVLVFTMPNQKSVKRLSRRYSIPYGKTTEAELRSRLERGGWEILELTGFSKLPDLFYRRLHSPRLSRSLLAFEAMLDRLMGPGIGARELFVAVRRPLSIPAATS